VVDVSRNTQIERIKNRDRLGEKEILPILDMQCSREDRLKAADDVVTNEGTPEDLAIQIAHLHQKFQQLATE
jgi:dephospho-CoA kinase